MIYRRQLLKAPAALLAASSVRSAAAVGSRPAREPCTFSLGVASGDPSADGIVLWTRLCAAPDGSVLVDDEIIEWELATDPALQNVVGRGKVIASSRRAHCVHVFLDGLEPATRYYYRFHSRCGSSAVGAAKTLPTPGQPVGRFRIALASCQEYTSGYFNAYDDLVANTPDLVFFTGDYIYESGAGVVRPFPFKWKEAFTLDQYRALYALYRQDASLRQAHANAPWVVIWDDHEVVNDWGPEHFLPSPYNNPQPAIAHIDRVGAARRAFFEHMPLRASAVLYDGQEMPLYRQLVVGDLIELTLLDVRSFRDRPACKVEDDLAFSPCEALDGTDRSLLGEAQERWFLESFHSHDCRWPMIGQTTVLAPVNRGTESEPRFEVDSWDNYPQSRARLLESVASSGAGNVVSLGGNIHAFYSGSLELSGAGGSLQEIVTTSISASGGDETRYQSMTGNRDLHPGMSFFENRHRGYALLDVERDHLRCQFKVVDSIGRPKAESRTLHSFALARR